MAREEIIERVISLVRATEENKLRGSIHQEAYKEDFFRLFAEAFNAGMMHGSDDVLYADALADAVGERAPELVETNTFRTLHTFWHEWTFAWKRCHLKRES